MIVVLMGVSGSGKTTIGTLLASHLGVPFADADDFHTDENRARMAAGTALTDDDREPWLLTLGALLQQWCEAGAGGVLACSALRAAYRTTMTAGLPAGTVRFVALEGSRELIAARLAARHHAFMSPLLLDSQLATLELTGDAVRVVNDRTPDEVVAEIVRRLTPGTL